MPNLEVTRDSSISCKKDMQMLPNWFYVEIKETHSSDYIAKTFATDLVNTNNFRIGNKHNLQIQAQLGQQMPWFCDTCLLSAYLTSRIWSMYSNSSKYMIQKFITRIILE